MAFALIENHASLLQGDPSQPHIPEHDEQARRLNQKFYPDVDVTGVVDARAEILSSIASAKAAGGGEVILPPGFVVTSDVFELPSRVSLVGQGQRATNMIPTTGHTGYRVLITPDGASDENLYGQGMWAAVRGMTFCDPDSNDVNLTPGGRSQRSSGIKIVEMDWIRLTDLEFRDLNGTAIDMADVVREALVDNVYVTSCGNSSDDEAAIELFANTGDASNTNTFRDLHVTLSHYYGLRIDGSVGSTYGPRHILLEGCQFEGGGNGTGATLGHSFPYDLIRAVRCQSLHVHQTHVGNAGQGVFCINLLGDATYPMQYFSMVGKHIGDYDATGGSTGSGGINFGYIDYANIDFTYWGSCPVGKGVLSGHFPTVHIGPSNSFLGGAGNGDFVGAGGVAANLANLRGIRTMGMAGLNGYAPKRAQSTLAPVIVNSDTISTADVQVARVNPGAAVTGIILQAGHGVQRITVMNHGSATAAFSVTFAASGTSNVLDGTNVVIAGMRSRDFDWDSTLALWVAV